MIRIKHLNFLILSICLQSQMMAAAPDLQPVPSSRFLEQLIAHIAYYFLGNVRAAYADHPYSRQQAAVRFGYDIDDQEKAFVTQRLPKAQKALETLLSTTLSDDNIPRIAFCCSGGGYRAMLGTLGALKGAEQVGLLDASMYMAGVSGSAWACAALTQSGMSVANCLEQISHALNKDIDDYNYQQVTDALYKQIAFTRQCSVVDFYGALLAQTLLQQPAGKDVNAITFASQAEKIASAQLPCPLACAVIDYGDMHYEWVEFTPYEVSSMFLGAAIPSWAFGRQFKAGYSQDFDPAQPLGFGLGIWGSSFCANAKDIADNYQKQAHSTLISYFFSRVVNSLPDMLLEERFISPAQVANWTYDTKQPYARHKNLQLLDAGFDCNLPFLPLLRKARPVDIIIVIDASEEVGAVELRKAEQYARAHNIAFPPIDYTQVTLPCSVHAQWSDPHVPIIIYFPLIAQAGYQQGWDPQQADFTSTFNFHYTYEQACLLSGLSEYAMVQHKQTIIDTIMRVMQ